MDFLLYCHTIPTISIFFLRFPLALLISQAMVYHRLRVLLRLYPSMPCPQMETARATLAPFRGLNHYVFMSMANNVMQLCDNCFQTDKVMWTLAACVLLQIILLLRAKTLEKYHQQLVKNWSNFHSQTN